MICLFCSSPLDIEILYDYMGRRVQKEVYAYDGADWNLQSERLYVYDGWNLIQELDGTGAVQKYYLWGLDLSQSLQGAGGVGGLLAVIDNPSSTMYYCQYDANGNLTQLVKSSDGSIAAHYEYDPFGNLNYSSGSYANQNPFKFSTKYHDEETGLVYYGYRYYSPELGRWVNRDPLEENGGINLYGFVLNNPLNKIDHLGLWVHPNGIISPNEAVKIISDIEYYHYSFSQFVMNDNADGLKSLFNQLAFGTFNTDYIDGSTNKWMFTCKYGWIDIGHFFSSAYFAQQFGSETVYQFSKFVELGQTFKLAYQSLLSQKGDPTSESAGTPEDLNSNYQGAFFSHGGLGTVSTSFEDFSRKAGAVHLGIGPTKARAILEEDVRSLLKRDKGGNLSIYTGDRIYSIEKQLEYQKESLKAFCLLCDGDKPKKEYQY